jgi:hypothetical protein
LRGRLELYSTLKNTIMAMTHYFLQSKLNDKIHIVGHSTDEETGEVYFKFLDKSKVKKLMADEMKVSPEYEYRIVKVTENIDLGRWEKANNVQNSKVSSASEAK